VRVTKKLLVDLRSRSGSSARICFAAEPGGIGESSHIHCTRMRIPRSNGLPPPQRHGTSRIGSLLRDVTPSVKPINRWPNLKLPHLRPRLPASAAHPLPSMADQGAPGRLSSKPWKRPAKPRPKTQLCAKPLGWEEPLYEDVRRHWWPKGNRHPPAGSQRQRVPGRAEARGAAGRPAKAPQGQHLQQRHRQPWLRGQASGLRPTSCANNMDAAEYRRVLGLIFLKYNLQTASKSIGQAASPAFGDYEGANPEDPGNTKAENVFWVPGRGPAEQLAGPMPNRPTIGKLVDDAMVAISAQPTPQRGRADYVPRAGPTTAPGGTLIDVIAQRSNFNRRSEKARALSARAIAPWISGRGVTNTSSPALPQPRARTAAILTTPRCVGATAWWRSLSPTRAASTTPLGSGGNVRAEREVFRGKPRRPVWATFPLRARRATPTNRRLAVGYLGLARASRPTSPEPCQQLPPRQFIRDLRANYVIANPPFNAPTGSARTTTLRCKYGTYREGQTPTSPGCKHFIHHLRPDGMAGFVLANRSMSSNQSGEGEIAAP